MLSTQRNLIKKKKKKKAFLEVNWVLISDLWGFSGLDSGWNWCLPILPSSPTWRTVCTSTVCFQEQRQEPREATCRKGRGSPFPCCFLAWFLAECLGFRINWSWSSCGPSRKASWRAEAEVEPSSCCCSSPVAGIQLILIPQGCS